MNDPARFRLAGFFLLPSSRRLIVSVMKKEFVALLLLAVLLLPMLAGIRRIRNLPGKPPKAPPTEDADA